MTDPRLRPDDESVVTLLSRAVSEAQNVARAEIELQKLRLLARVGEAKSGAILAGGALIAGSLALVGLVVGMLLIVSAYLGPVWATVIVVGVLLVAGAVMGWLALRHFKTMFAPAADLAEVTK